jgi:signal transduction histidine kinase
MLKKVFFDLLDNTLRHGERVSEIRVSFRETTDNLIIVWEDNGVGIREEEKDQIFDRGFGKNTGFGLFLVREILSLTDISILENGIPGEGARFEMTVQKGMFQIIDDQSR